MAKKNNNSNESLGRKIKLIIRSVREYKKYAIITPLFMIGEAAVECALPFVMSLLVNAIEGATSVNTLTPYIVAVVLMAVVSITCGILGGVFASKASAGFAKNLRHDIYEKVQSLSFENIDKFSASSLVTRMTTDINSVQMAFQMCIRIVFRAPLMLVFSVIMAFVTGGNLAWVFIGIIPVIVGGFLLIIKFAMGIFRKVFKRYDGLNQSIQENISGIRVVKSYVREDFENNKFSETSNSLTKSFIKAEKIVALNNPIMNTAIHVVNIVVFWVAALIITKTSRVDLDGITILWGKLSVAQMSALLTYGIQVLMSIMMVSMIMVMLSMSLEAIRRIGEVLIEEPTIRNPENPIYELDDGSVIFNNVNFKYAKTAEKNTLENLNINIKSGQFIGILGSTGSGKTSLVNLISRLYDISEGELIVGGHPVQEYDLKTLRDSVAVVLQKNFLFSGTINSNLRWGDINASDEEVQKACKIAQADEFIQNFPDKYDTKIEQGGTNVSGGQKQRLCIARAILKKPRILILDDSTSAVDTKTDALIRKGLKEDIPETTKIVIAQRISSIEDADQIIILDDGKINAIGTHEELLKNNAIYQEVYYTQNKKGGTK
ncbi:MAG: ABC transporter ATP-binding protein/permease [Bacilli bacterium]|nr:ABC transporter ATP-binding protein/permease [Bacilli bacterium]